jgi:hypothetical protein
LFGWFGQSGSGSLFKSFFYEGIHHILTGYDHLLFVSALVLAATTFWDLIKVVTTFTIAHTITLTLGAFNLVSLPHWVVEPLISASIVFVALQNVFWPSRARGWSRLGAAFFFGLFYGLGFAGGLLEAIREMQTGTMLLAHPGLQHRYRVRASDGCVTLIRFPEGSASLSAGCRQANASINGVPADRVGGDFHSRCLLPLPSPNR